MKETLKRKFNEHSYVYGYGSAYGASPALLIVVNIDARTYLLHLYC